MGKITLYEAPPGVWTSNYHPRGYDGYGSGEEGADRLHDGELIWFSADPAEEAHGFPFGAERRDAGNCSIVTHIAGEPDLGGSSTGGIRVMFELWDECVYETALVPLAHLLDPTRVGKWPTG